MTESYREGRASGRYLRTLSIHVALPANEGLALFYEFLEDDLVEVYCVQAKTLGTR